MAGSGVDFSTLRPEGSLAVSSGGVASGPVSFMKVWEEAGTVLESSNLRRGAMMATLRCDHPDIESFIEAKITGGTLQHFNLSVLVTDEFMQAVEKDGPWALVFPLGEHAIPVGGEVCERVWSGDLTPQLCLVHRRIPARALLDKLLAAEQASAEPGVLFIDRINSVALRIVGSIRDTAYRTSIAIAQEKGVFPAFDKTKYGASPFVLGLSHDIQDAVAQHGIRNSHLLAVAPTGSISLLANNVSSGIEPVFAFKANRRVRGADGQTVTFDVEDAAWHQYQELHGHQTSLPAHFVQAVDVSAEDQLRMMATVQSCVDNAISKTVRLPESASAQELGVVLRRAWELGLKGCAVYREGSRGGETAIDPQPPQWLQAASNGRGDGQRELI